MCHASAHAVRQYMRTTSTPKTCSSLPLRSLPPPPGAIFYARVLPGYTQVSAKLEVLGATPCPRFHADHVGVRLLVTYLGPGTLYVENRWVGMSGEEGRGSESSETLNRRGGQKWEGVR